MTQKYIHENDCRYLNEFDIPYLNDLGCGYINEEYVDVVEVENEDEEIEAELAWYFEKLGILEDGICGTCIAAYHRGFERGGEWQFRVAKNIGFESVVEGLEKVINTMNLTSECENIGITKKQLEELVASLQTKYTKNKGYED
jgi:hypothetical protein